MSAILDDETLHRRLHPTHVKDDGSLSSAAFTDPEMSVDRASIWTAEESLRAYPGKGIAAFTAGFARGVKEPQEVVADPGLFLPAHALVKGKKTKATQKQFAKGSLLVVRPETASSSGSVAEPDPVAD